MRQLAQECRYGFRTYWKSAGATSVALIALALGIGANSAVFSVVNGLLIRPLPYTDAERLAVVTENNLSKGVRKLHVSPLDFRDFAARNDVFDRVGAFRTQSSVLTGQQLPERIETASVSPAVFDLLGLKPSLGRAFMSGEDQPGQNAVVVLSDGLWRRRFGGDRTILGRTLILDGASYAVIGVAPAQFRLPASESELWIPYTPDAKALAPSSRAYHVLDMLAHLKPGVTWEQAQSQMRTIAGNLAQDYPQTSAGYSAEVSPLREQLIGDLRPTLWALIGAVSAVLLIACVNIAHLLLVRAGMREKEIAVRAAVGATPGRIIRQLLTESVLLAMAGGAAGLLLAYWATSVLVKLGPATLRRSGDISLDWRVLAFTLGISLLTGVLFGLAPALTGASADVNSILKTSGRSSSGHRQRSRMRDTLVVCEIASCVILLIAAGLFLRSFSHLQQVNPGFRSDHVLTMQISLPQTRYSGLRVEAFYKQLLERVQDLPGVQSAGICRFLPLSGTDATLNFQIEGQPPLPSADQPIAKFRAASGGYFAALRIRLLRGRFFDRTDDERTPKVVIINDTAARRYWPNEDPIGKRIQSGLQKDQWSKIVGVIGDVKHAGLDAEINPETYYHFLQIPPETVDLAEATMALVVRTSTDPAALLSAVENEVRRLDPEQPVFNVKTMEDVVRDSVAQPRFRTLMLGLFAGLALLLAAIGLYGVMAFSVTQRIHELGIRMALGADPIHIVKLVVGHGVFLSAIGLGIGLALAFPCERVISGLLFGVKATDLPTLAATCAIVLAVGATASFVPAVRATKIDPVGALRIE